MHTFRRPLQTRAMQTMSAWRRATMTSQRNMMRTPSGLLLPAQASFGGMMGMGELADIMAGKCDPNDAI